MAIDIAVIPQAFQYFILPYQASAASTIQRYVQRLGSAKCGTVLKLSSEMRSLVNTNSVREQLRTRQFSSKAARSGAARTDWMAVPINPPDVKRATRRPRPDCWRIRPRARWTRWRKTGQHSAGSTLLACQ